jgi:photosystem II stability/assembly factor-like uncharacterized protein
MLERPRYRWFAGRMRSQSVALLLSLLVAVGVMASSQASKAAPGADRPPRATRAAVDGVGVTRLRHGTAHDALYDVAFEGQRGMAVGAFGSVLVTADGGSSWQAQPFPDKSLALMSVAMREGRCITVGQTGRVYTADDCRTWRAAPSGTPSRLLAVGLNRHGIAYAVGAFGTIVKSTDWGKSWASEPIDWKGLTPDGAEPHLYGVHVADDGAVTVVGEFELVLRSRDGRSWKPLHQGARSLFGLTVLEGGRLYVTGQSGALLSSKDDGVTWASHKTGSEAILTGIHATPQGKVIASGINTLLVSSDSGASWNKVNSMLLRNAWLQALGSSVRPDGKRLVVAVGWGGSILEVDL